MISLPNNHGELTMHTSSTDFGDVAGFLAVDNTNQLVVLSFRGSHTISNWIANLDFDQTDASSLCSGCQAHSGFLKAWEAVADDLTSRVASATAANPSYRLVLTGHSFGGAVAALGGTALRNAGYTLDLVSTIHFLMQLYDAAMVKVGANA